MGYLPDTHVVLWLINGDSRLKPRILTAIEESSSNYWSIVSLWEIATKTSQNQSDVDMMDGWIHFIPKEMERNGIASVEIIPAHCNEVSQLLWHHKDSFDRLLIATAMAEDLIIVTCDQKFRDYPVEILW